MRRIYCNQYLYFEWECHSHTQWNDVLPCLLLDTEGQSFIFSDVWVFSVKNLESQNKLSLVKDKQYLLTHSTIPGIVLTCTLFYYWLIFKPNQRGRFSTGGYLESRSKGTKAWAQPASFIIFSWMFLPYHEVQLATYCQLLPRNAHLLPVFEKMCLRHPEKQHHPVM